jgi:nitroreductase
MLDADLPAAFKAIIEARYACKAFDPTRSVPEETLSAILELTRRAPTSLNTQPWVAVLVKGEDARARLAEAMMPGNRPKVLSAPLNVVFAADLEPEKLLTPETPDFVRSALPSFVSQSSPEAWAFKQTMMAAQTFLLAAAAHSVQTNPMEGFTTPAAVRDAVGLPAHFSVPVVISVGYEAAPRAKASTRYPLESLFYTDAYK